MKNPVNRKVRWVPAIAILALAAIVLVAIWSWIEMPGQKRIERTAITAGVAGFFLFLWLVFYSGLRWKARLAILGVGLVLVGAFAATFRITGVTGDLAPIIEPRWASRREAPAPPAKPAERAAPPQAASVEAPAADFPQLYGPERNARLAGPNLATNWTETPPLILWKQPIGAAWSGFAIKGGIAVTMEQRGDQECVTAYDLLTGRSLWTHSDQARYATTIAGEGPRTTPTIDGNRVYTFGATGILNCLDLQTGTNIWRADTAREHQASVPDWGFASSPLLINGQVIVCAGGQSGSLAAYDAKTGKLAWSSGSGGADYSSPMHATLLDTPQILIFDTKGVSGHALDGGLLWSHPWRGGHPHVTMPTPVGTNQVLVSSGYGTGAELLRLSRAGDGRWNAERVWKSMAMKSKFGPLLVRRDFAYGFDDGIFACVELKSGQRVWKDGRYGHGQGLLVRDLILLTSEKGEVILISPNPSGLSEASRFKVFTEKTWNPPALAGEYLLVRNHKEAACLKLPLKKELEKT